MNPCTVCIPPVPESLVPTRQEWDPPKHGTYALMMTVPSSVCGHKAPLDEKKRELKEKHLSSHQLAWGPRQWSQTL